MHQIVGYRKVKSHMKTDWMSQLKKVKGKDWKNIYHIVILPTYKEGAKIIKETIDSLVSSNYPKEKIIVVLSIEEKAGKEFWQMAKRIEQKYTHTFFTFLICFNQFISCSWSACELIAPVLFTAAFTRTFTPLIVTSFSPSNSFRPNVPSP